MKTYNNIFNVPLLLILFICISFLMYSLEVNNIIFKYINILFTIFSASWLLFIIFIWLNKNRYFHLNIKKIIKCADNNSFKLLILFSFFWIIITLSMLIKDNIVKDTLKILLINSQHLKPNEWGDFFAGFIAPLAFIWIGFGVYYQKKEFANLIKSFDLQKKEFIKSVDVMKEQAIQIEIQQHNTWFNRNINSYNATKERIYKVSETDALFEIYKALQVSIESEKKFFNVFDEIKLISDIRKNIYNTIDIELKKENLHIKIENTLLELKKEFSLLEDDDYNYCEKILNKIYVLIVAGERIEFYERYKERYGSWIDKKLYTDINNLINSQKKDSYSDKVKFAFDKI